MKVKTDRNVLLKYIDDNRAITGTDENWGVPVEQRLPVFNDLVLKRTQGEVDAYYECLDSLKEPFELSERTIKGINFNMLKYDERYQDTRGEYAIKPNDMIVRHHDGVTPLLIPTTPIDSKRKELLALIDWFNNGANTENLHPLIRISLFKYQFILIHPFPDGNGRTSRILLVLLLLKAGYSFIKYRSLENLIEYHKYYYKGALLNDQLQSDCRQNINGDWPHFFLLSCKLLIQDIKEPAKGCLL